MSMRLMPFDVCGYMFAADIYCGHCVLDHLDADASHIDKGVEYALDAIATEMGIERYDEGTFDSDDFPKVLFRDSVLENDDHCADCHRKLGEGTGFEITDQKPTLRPHVVSADPELDNQ